MGEKKGRLFHLRLRPGPVTAGFIALVLLSTLGTKAILAYTDSPEFCAKCHVMEPQYEGWFHSAHRLGATCSDCHTPHQNLPIKLLNKGYDGTKDFIFFYTNHIDDPIKISTRGARIVRDNCLRCHAGVMENIADREERNCWECHRSLPHGY